jgi:hypothetical protein
MQAARWRSVARAPASVLAWDWSVQVLERDAAAVTGGPAIDVQHRIFERGDNAARDGNEDVGMWQIAPGGGDAEGACARAARRRCVRPKRGRSEEPAAVPPCAGWCAGTAIPARHERIVALCTGTVRAPGRSGGTSDSLSGKAGVSGRMVTAQC